MTETTECLVCGKNINIEIALYHTNRPDCCDNCAMDRREEYLKLEKLKTVNTWNWSKRMIKKWVNCIVALDEQDMPVGVIYTSERINPRQRVKTPVIDIQDVTRMKEIRHPPSLEKVKKAYNHYI